MVITKHRDTEDTEEHREFSEFHSSSVNLCALCPSVFRQFALRVERLGVGAREGRSKVVRDFSRLNLETAMDSRKRTQRAQRKDFGDNAAFTQRVSAFPVRFQIQR